MPREAPAGCIDPAVGRLTEAFCFGELLAPEREMFAAHVLECDACWRDVQRIDEALEGLARLRRPARGPSVSAHTRSPSMSRWFGHHVRFATAMAILYGSLCGLAFIVEVAYVFDRFASWAPAASLLGAGAGAATLLASFAVTRSGIVSGRTGAGFWGLAVLTLGSALLAGAYASLLPAEPLVAARFQTFPASLAVIKTMFWTVLPAVAFVLVPFASVATIEYSLSEGRFQAVLLVMLRHPLAVSRPTLWAPRTWTFCLAALIMGVWDFVGMSHLFDGLLPGPYLTLYMSLRLARFMVLITLGVLACTWYGSALANAKLNALSGVALLREDRPHAGDPTLS